MEWGGFVGNVNGIKNSALILAPGLSLADAAKQQGEDKWRPLMDALQRPKPTAPTPAEKSPAPADRPSDPVAKRDFLKLLSYEDILNTLNPIKNSSAFIHKVEIPLIRDGQLHLVQITLDQETATIQGVIDSHGQYRSPLDAIGRDAVGGKALYFEDGHLMVPMPDGKVVSVQQLLDNGEKASLTVKSRNDRKIERFDAALPFNDIRPFLEPRDSGTKVVAWGLNKDREPVQFTVRKNASGELQFTGIDEQELKELAQVWKFDASSYSNTYLYPFPKDALENAVPVDLKAEEWNPPGSKDLWMEIGTRFQLGDALSFEQAMSVLRRMVGFASESRLEEVERSIQGVMGVKVDDEMLIFNVKITRQGIVEFSRHNGTWLRQAADRSPIIEDRFGEIVKFHKLEPATYYFHVRGVQ